MHLDPTYTECEVYRHEPSNSASLPSDFVYSVSPWTSGYLLTTARGVAWLDPQDGTMERLPGTDHLGVYFMQPITEDLFLLGSNQGLFSWQSSSQTLTQVAVDADSQPPDFYHIARAQNGAWWLGSTAGLFRWSAGGLTAVDVADQTEHRPLNP